MNSRAASLFRNPWPHLIVAWFVVFASALAAWTAFALRQRVDLVRPDYYEEEVRFQSQLDRLNRTAGLRGEVRIAYDASKGEISVVLPETDGSRQVSGRIQFYRPSDASLDVGFPLEFSGAGVRPVDVSALRPGSWRVRVHWKAGAEEYYYEQAVVFAEAVNPRAAGGLEKR